MYAEMKYSNELNKIRLFKTRQWLHDHQSVIKKGEKLKPIRTTMLPHLVTLSIAILEKVPPYSGKNISYKNKADCMSMLLFANETAYAVIGKSHWVAHLKRRQIPTKNKFAPIMQYLIDAELFERTINRYSGDDNFKTARYFITEKGKKLASELVVMSELLHTIGINNPNANEE